MSPTTKSPDALSPSRHQHPLYFLVGGDLFFLIGSTLIRVHSYFFRRDSTTFEALLDAPTANGEFKRGTSENPIEPTDVTLEELEAFLWVYYNPRYNDYSEATATTYAMILKLADKYQFPNVKTFAIEGLQLQQDITLSQRIALYRRYQVPRKYVIPLLVEVILRIDEDQEWITEEEIMDVGLPVATYLIGARDRLHKFTKGGIEGWDEKTAKRALGNTPGKDTILKNSGPSSPVVDKYTNKPTLTQGAGSLANPAPSN